MFNYLKMLNKHYDGFLRFCNGDEKKAKEYYEIWVNSGEVELSNGKVCKVPSMLCNNRGEGHKISEDHKEKIRCHNRNRVWSEESRAKSSKSVSEYLQENGNPMQGKKHTAEARKKITEANLNRDTCKGKLHYAFKGSEKKSHPTGESHHRLKGELYDNYVEEHGMVCELCGEKFNNSELDSPDKVIMHHFCDIRKVIDIVQDVNKDWNTMFIHKKCHTKIHNKLRGMNAKIPKEAWSKYVSRHNSAVRKMNGIIKVEKEKLKDA